MLLVQKAEQDQNNVNTYIPSPAPQPGSAFTVRQLRLDLDELKDLTLDLFSSSKT